MSLGHYLSADTWSPDHGTLTGERENLETTSDPTDCVYSWGIQGTFGAWVFIFPFLIPFCRNTYQSILFYNCFRVVRMKELRRTKLPGILVFTSWWECHSSKRDGHLIFCYSYHLLITSTCQSLGTACYTECLISCSHFYTTDVTGSVFLTRKQADIDYLSCLQSLSSPISEVGF